MKLELCASSIEAIELAKKYQFDRIELCQTLEQGGLTPSPGLIEYALAYGLEVHVLIRPRPGGFHYSSGEFEIMLRDIREARQIGAHGVVVGVLNEKGLIDEEALQVIKDQTGEMCLTFHRAFDETFEFDQSLQALLRCGVQRVLSSGLSSKVDGGMGILTQMVNAANNKIEIMAGGGVNAANIGQLIDQVKPHAIHFSATRRYQLDEESLFSESILKVDESKVARLVEIARGIPAT